MAKKTTKPLKPVNTLVKKRSLLVPILIVAVVIIAAVAIYFFARSSSQGTILATVNGEPIYSEDIAGEYARLPKDYQAQYTKEYLLNQTIDKTLLLQEAKRRGILVTDKDVDAELQNILAQFGIGMPDLQKILTAQNMTMDQYRKSVSEQLLLNKVVQEAVISKVFTSDSEIMQYYEAHTTEFTAPPGGVVVSHILVSNQTTAKQIIAMLNNGSSFASLASQYSIDTGSKDQGGYIGIVTNSSGYVQEFVNASIALRKYQYTKTPVKSQFGYHVIIRLDDTEPYKQVRDQINKQLQLSKQMAGFKTFVQSLRDSAVIKYYSGQGLVTQQAPLALDAFSTCVATKATFYGTSWSDFTVQQKALFGDSFSRLKFVDCDLSPSDCASANVQKYPTWVIDGQQYGKMTLQEIADKTGCTLAS